MKNPQKKRKNKINYSLISRKLSIILHNIDENNKRIEKILHTLNVIQLNIENSNGTQTITPKSCSDISITQFSQNLINELKSKGKFRKAETYSSSVNSFIRFRKGMDIEFSQIDSNLITEYENYLKIHQISPNTSSFYIRNLRAIYNQAVEQGLSPQRHPFKRAYTGIAETAKRFLPIDAIQKIATFDPMHQFSLEFARDMFLFSFYTRGMALIDMAHLTQNNLHKDYLVYYRQKTNKPICIKWEKCMQNLVDKYKEHQGPYLLPIIRTPNDMTRKQYNNTAHRINHALHKIGALLNLPIPLTMYVARHSWASLAKKENVPLSIISEAMGHTSEKTTRIYIASLGNTAVDKANQRIIQKI